MCGLSKTATVALLIGLTCFGLAVQVSALEQDEEEEEMGEVPSYYLQLQDFTAALEEESLRPQIEEYTVQPGDCLYTIADEFGTDVNTLAQLNDLANPGLIHPGERLEILTVVGCVHDVEAGDTVTAIAGTYGVDEEAILQANIIEDESALPRGERVIIPGGVLSRSNAQPAFQWPLQGRITSGYGWRKGKFHYGIDISALYGTAFHAAAGGRVSFVGYRGSYGLMIEVDHGAGYRSRYAHACTAAVSPGQKVKSGQKLGCVGLTGNTTGPHLHFEIHEGDKKADPLQFLD